MRWVASSRRLEAVLDSKWYRQTKFIVAAVAIAVAGSLGAAAYVSSTVPDYATPGASSQCDLPFAQRTGGWVCPSP